MLSSLFLLMSVASLDSVSDQMALGQQVAPQAYTRETLAQAYAWVQEQPENIRKMATSPDFLVGLYLRYQRQTENEVSPSAQNFKADLKHLAGDFGALEQTEPPALGAWHHRLSPLPYPGLTRPIRPQAPPEPALQLSQHLDSSYAASFTPPPSPPAASAPPPPVTSSLEGILDERSLKMVQDVKAKLNLGSDIEACRALVAMGFERMRPLFN